MQNPDPSATPDDVGADPRVVHAGEGHSANQASKLNWLRAGVLGANDGIISQAGLLVGVAGATTDRAAIFVAAIAGISAGAISMALGEYVSVSSQRDAEKHLIAKEEKELATDPEVEFAELTALYQAKGLTPATAHQVAKELTQHDVLAAHLEAELGIDPDELTSPTNAAIASAISFTLGGLIPTLAMIIATVSLRVPVTVVAVLAALAITGLISASIGGGSKLRAIARLLIGGALAMGITFLIGRFVGGGFAG